MIAGRGWQMGGLLVGLLVLNAMGGEEVVGQYVLALAITTPFVLFANMQLNVAICGDEGQRRPLRQFVWHRVLLQLAAWLASSIVAVAVFDDRASRLAVVSMGLAKAVESGGDLLCGWFQGRGRMDLVARSLAARGAAGCLGLTLGFVATESLVAAHSLMAMGWASSLLLHDLPALRTVGARPPQTNGSLGHSPGIGRLALAVLPLGVSSALASLELNAPRYLIAALFSDTELGRYSLIATLVLGGQLVVTAVSQTALPRMSDLNRRRDAIGLRRLVKHVYLISLGTGLLLVASAIAVGPWLVEVMGWESIAGTYLLMVLLAAAATTQFGVAVLLNSLRAMQDYRGSVFVHLFGLATTAAAIPVMAIVIGLPGVAAGVALSSGASTMLLAWMLRSRFASLSQPSADAPTKLTRTAA